MNELINYKAVCRTAPATPGLLTRHCLKYILGRGWPNDLLSESQKYWWVAPCYAMSAKYVLMEIGYVQY